MEAAPDPGKSALAELEQIDRALSALRECEGSLGTRRASLIEYLEEATRPATRLPVAPAMQRKGFSFRGVHESCRFDIDIYTGVLEAMWQAFPEKRDAMAAAAAMCGNYRPYVSRTRAALFPTYLAHRAFRFSRRLGEDWYVDTNMNSTRMERILPAVVRAAGLVWGRDVAVFWRDGQRQP